MDQRLGVSKRDPESAPTAVKKEEVSRVRLCTAACSFCFSGTRFFVCDFWQRKNGTR